MSEDFIVKLLVARQMSGGASRGESSRKTEDDDALVSEQIRGSNRSPVEGVLGAEGGESVKNQKPKVLIVAFSSV